MVYRQPKGRGDTSKTSWLWKKARNWTRSLFSNWMITLRMEKEENKRQGQIQLVSNPPIKKNKHVVWRRPPENVWLEAFGPAIATRFLEVPWLVGGWGSAPQFCSDNSGLNLFLCSFFVSLFFLLYLNVLVKRERCPCLKQQALFFFVVQFNIIQPNAKTTNKYEFNKLSEPWSTKEIFLFCQSLW